MEHTNEMRRPESHGEMIRQLMRSEDGGVSGWAGGEGGRDKRMLAGGGGVGVDVPLTKNLSLRGVGTGGGAVGGGVKQFVPQGAVGLNYEMKF